MVHRQKLKATLGLRLGLQEQDETELSRPERWGNPAARLDPNTSFDGCSRAVRPPHGISNSISGTGIQEALIMFN